MFGDCEGWIHREINLMSISTITIQNQVGNSFGWKYFYGDGCPVCDDSRNDCRQSLSTGLYHCRVDTAVNSSFTFIELDNNGFGMWSDGCDFKPTTARQSLKAQPKRSAIKPYPADPAQRHKEIKKILRDYPLSPKDKEGLLKRGLTEEEIKAGYFGSIPYDFPPAPRDIDPNFPGVGANGKLGARMGLICPVINVDGFMVGFQIRQTNETNGKYRWLTSTKSKGTKGYQMHLPHGEMPIHVAVPDEVKHEGIGIDEGVLKTDITAKRWGKVVVGAAGGNFKSSEQEFIRTLQELSRQYQTDIVHLMPDAGAMKNEQVWGQFEKAAEIATKAGFKCSVLWWGQEEKGIGHDPDEVTPQEIANAVEQPLTAPKQAEKEGEPVEDKSEARKRFEKSVYRRLTQLDKGDIRYIDKQYLDVSDVPNLSQGVFTMHSVYGTNKTGLMAEIRKRFPDTQLITLHNRNVLGRQTSQRLNTKHLQDNLKAGNRLKGYEDMSLCIDSLHHVDPGAATRYIVFVDEAESVGQHLALGSTIKDAERARYFAYHQNLIKNAHAVILADADMSDTTTDYYVQLRGQNETPNVLYNAYVPKREAGIKVYIDKGVRDDCGNNLAECMIIGQFKADIKAGRNAVFATDNRKLAYAVQKEIDPGNQLKGMVISQDTADERQQKLIMSNPNKYVTERGLQYLIYTPSAESGFSIDVPGHFEHIYGRFTGVVNPNTAMQMMHRVRGDVPKTMCIPQRAYVDNDNDSCTPSGVAKRQKDIATQSLGLVSKELIGDLYKEKQDALADWFTHEDIHDEKALRERHEAVFNRIKDWMSFGGDFETIHFEYSCKLKARDNYARLHFKDVLMDLLIAAGYDAEFIEVDSKTERPVFAPAQRLAVELEQAEQINEAEDITDEEYQELQREGTSTREIKAKLARYYLQTTYPAADIDDREVVWKLSTHDGGRWAKGVTLHWMSQNIEVSAMRNARKWLAMAKNDTFSPFDVPTEYLKVKAIKSLRLEEILIPDVQLSTNSPEVKAFIDRIKQDHKADLKALGIKPNTKLDGFAFINKLLNHISLQFEFDTKIMGERFYKLDLTDTLAVNLRAKINESCFTRFLGAKTAETYME